MPLRTFAVIGGGVAGLQAASQLKGAGYDVTIFEKTHDVGGVWQRNYAGYKLQVRKWHYEIPGYPWPQGVDPKYPSGEEVQAYLRSYAQDSGLLPLTRFGVEVKALRPLPSSEGVPEGSSGWEVEWSDGRATHKGVFDFVVVATGLFNKPERPAWAEGLVRPEPPHAGSGPWVVDAKDFTDASLAQGKHVVVVGAGKTAHDVGTAVSKVAASTTLAARRGHWMAPQIVLGFIPFEFASYTRWAWALQPAWYAAGPIKKFFHALFSPIKAAVWGLFGFLFPLHTSTPGNIKPRHGLLEGIYDTVGMVDSRELSRAFKSKRLATRAARVESVTHTGVVLTDGTELQADIVVLATGYRATARELLPEGLQRIAGYKDGNQWLYRNVLPPELSNIAFIGLNATFQHVLTTALQSRWLVDALNGAIPLPPQAEQLADVASQERWHKKSRLNRSNNFVWAQHGKYHDQLVADIRGSTSAYSRWNLPAEWFFYIKNSLYAPLFPGNLALRSSKGGKGGPVVGTAPKVANVAAAAS